MRGDVVGGGGGGDFDLRGVLFEQTDPCESLSHFMNTVCERGWGLSYVSGMNENETVVGRDQR